MGLFYFDSFESLQKKIPAFIAISFSFSILYNIIYFKTLGLDVDSLPLTLQDYLLSFQGWLVTLIIPILINFLPDLEIPPDEDQIKIDNLNNKIKLKIKMAENHPDQDILNEINSDIREMERQVQNFSNKTIEYKRKVTLKFRFFSLVYTLVAITFSLILQYYLNYKYIFIINIFSVSSAIPYLVVSFIKNNTKYIKVSCILSLVMVCSLNIVSLAIYDIIEGRQSYIYYNKHSSESTILRSLENGVFVYNSNNTFSFIYNNGNYIDYKIDKDVLKSIHQEKNACYIEILCKNED